jgi:hypothetical protein
MDATSARKRGAPQGAKPANRAKKAKKSAKQKSAETSSPSDLTEEETVVSTEARALLTTGSMRTSSQAFVRNQFLNADEAMEEFRDKLALCKSAKERYNLCHDLAMLVMLKVEVLEAQVEMVWDTVKTVDGFQQFKAADKELWQQVEEKAKSTKETAKRTTNAWKTIETRWGQEVAKRLTRVGVGHHFARTLLSMVKRPLKFETVVCRANRYAFERITNPKQGSRGVYTTMSDFHKAKDESAKDAKLTDEELARIGAKLDSHGLIIPITEEEKEPLLLQEPVGLKALGWFDEPLLPVEEQPRVMDDEELEEVLNEAAARKSTRSGKTYGRSASRADATSPANKTLKQAISEAKDRAAARPKENSDCQCQEKFDVLAMRILRRTPADLTPGMVVTFLKKAREIEELQMCTKHLQLIGGAMRLKTNLPPGVLQDRVKVREAM